MIAPGGIRWGTLAFSTASATTIALSYPTNPRSDDYLLCLAQSGAGNPIISNLTGFTSVWSFSNTGSTLLPAIYCGIKKATGTETGTITLSTPNGKQTAILAAVPGVDLFTPQDVAASTVDQATGSGSLIVPSMTLTRAFVFLAGLVGNNSSSNTFTQPTNWTEEYDTQTTSTPTEAAYFVPGVSGATGTMTWTASGSGKYCGGVVALRPAPPRAGLFMAG